MMLVNSDKKILIELVVNTYISDITDHFNTALRQGKLLQADEIWVVHFTVREQDESFIYPWPTETQSNLHLIHIWHDDEFTKLKIYKSTGLEEITLLKDLKEKKI